MWPTTDDDDRGGGRSQPAGLNIDDVDWMPLADARDLGWDGDPLRRCRLHR
jgi:hypothetical protein